MKVAGVVGWPVRHSLSPLIHRIFAEREGVCAAYLPIEVEPGADALGSALAALASAGFAGVNVTLPHKEDALRIADDASEAARRAGAANMLTFRDKRLYADNSDVAGFRAALGQARRSFSGAAALVLGAGGAARSVVAALKEEGVGEIRIANRTRGRAAAIADAAGAAVVDWEKRDAALGDVALLVNATSLGMTGEPPLDLDLSALPAAAVVADIVYAPLATPLLAAARARGLAAVDGLSMLMHQAAPVYRAWLGEVAVVDAALRVRLEAELARRAP